MQEKINRLEGRVDKLEAWQSSQLVDTAVNSERYNSITKRLDKIDSHISKLMWIVLAAIISGVMTFIMQGGLSVVS